MDHTQGLALGRGIIPLMGIQPAAAVCNDMLKLGGGVYLSEDSSNGYRAPVSVKNEREILLGHAQDGLTDEMPFQGIKCSLLGLAPDKRLILSQEVGKGLGNRRERPNETFIPRAQSEPTADLLDGGRYGKKSDTFGFRIIGAEMPFGYLVAEYPQHIRTKRAFLHRHFQACILDQGKSLGQVNAMLLECGAV